MERQEQFTAGPYNRSWLKVHGNSPASARSWWAASLAGWLPVVCATVTPVDGYPAPSIDRSGQCGNEHQSGGRTTDAAPAAAATAAAAAVWRRPPTRSPHTSIYSARNAFSQVARLLACETHRQDEKCCQNVSSVAVGRRWKPLTRREKNNTSTNSSFLFFDDDAFSPARKSNNKTVPVRLHRCREKLIVSWMLMAESESGRYTCNRAQ